MVVVIPGSRSLTVGSWSKPEANFFRHPISLQDQSGCCSLPPTARPRHKLCVCAGWREGSGAGVGVVGAGRRTVACCNGGCCARWWSPLPSNLPSCYLSPGGRGRGVRGGLRVLTGASPAMSPARYLTPRETGEVGGDMLGVGAAVAAGHLTFTLLFPPSKRGEGRV
jgi:hypothetical protein